MVTFFTIVVPVLVVLVVIGVMLKRFGAKTEHHREEVMAAPHTLRYHVPQGQDPAAVLVALSRAGFEAVTEPDNAYAVTIMCPLGPDQREEVRTVLENETASTLEGTERGEQDAEPAATPAGGVRFVDE